jgi:hypothetical protein
MQPMRRLVLLLALSAALLQPHAASAADTGTIEGRVMNGTTGKPQPGVEVTLTQGRGNSRDQLKVTTDNEGRYRFEDLRTGEDTFYVLDATYEGGLFAGRPLSIPSDTRQQPVIETTLRVFEPTTDPNAILIRRDDLFVVHDGDRLSVIEAIKVINPTQSAYIGRGSALSEADDDGVTPSLGFAIPDDVIPETFRWLDADLDVPEAVEIQGVGFGITSAIPPGEVDFTFSYQLEGQGGTFDISRRALYEVSELTVFAADPLEVTSNRLEREGEIELEGTRYDTFTSSEGIDPADPVQILIVAEGGTSSPFVLGAAGGLLVLTVIAILAFRRAKRVSVRPERDAAPDGNHEDLVAAIAELDLRYESGEIAESEYARRRADLKERAAATESKV